MSLGHRVASLTLGFSATVPCPELSRSVSVSGQGHRRGQENTARGTGRQTLTMRRAWVLVPLLLGACGSTPQDARVGTWYGPGGSPVPDGQPLVLSVEAGASHCGWQDVVFLAMAWPLDRPVRGGFMSDPRTHVYAWQPDDAYPSSSLTTTPRVVATMPSDARYTGLHRGPWQLWVSPSWIEFAVFLKSDTTIQRWPFVAKFVGCE
jgi:hypothetical protein